MTDWKKWIFVWFALVLTATGVILVQFGDSARLRIDDDKSTFYVLNNNSRWEVSGREYTKLYDGTSLLYRKSSLITLNHYYYNESIENWQEFNINFENLTEGKYKSIRYTPYKNNISIIETWYFDTTTRDIEMFPVDHTIECYNCGKDNLILHYEVSDLKYDGDTWKFKDLNNGIDDGVTSMNFGLNMKVEWDDINYYGKVYNLKTKDDKLVIRYRPENTTYYINDSNNNTIEYQQDYYIVHTRLFDPIWDDTTYTTNGTLFLYPNNISHNSNYNNVQGTGNSTVYSAYFSGSSSYINAGDRDFMSGDFSVSFWINSTETGSGDYIFQKGDRGGDGKWIGCAESGTATIYCYLDTGSAVYTIGDGGTSIPLNGLYQFVTLMRNDTVMELYNNGTLVDTQASSANNLDGNEDLGIGYSPYDSGKNIQMQMTNFQIFTDNKNGDWLSNEYALGRNGAINTSDADLVYYNDMSALTDMTGNNNGATAYNGVIVTDDNSFDFDGGDDYISAPTINVGSNFTYNFWLNANVWTSTHAEYLFTHGTGTNRVEAGHYVVSSNNVEFGINDGTWHYVQDTTNPTGSWIMYTLTYDNVDLKLYRDASLIDTEAVAGFSLDYSLIIGQNGQAFDGEIGSFAIFNETKSLDWIEFINESGRYYNFSSEDTASVINVTDLKPVADTEYANTTSYIEISANVTSDGTISSVNATIDAPNGSTFDVTLTQYSTTDKYNASFTYLGAIGTYNVTFGAYAGSISNTTETTNFTTYYQPEITEVNISTSTDLTAATFYFNDTLQCNVESDTYDIIEYSWYRNDVLYKESQNRSVPIKYDAIIQTSGIVASGHDYDKLFDGDKSTYMSSGGLGVAYLVDFSINFTNNINDLAWEISDYYASTNFSLPDSCIMNNKDVKLRVYSDGTAAGPNVRWYCFNTTSSIEIYRNTGDPLETYYFKAYESSLYFSNETKVLTQLDAGQYFICEANVTIDSRSTLDNSSAIRVRRTLLDNVTLSPTSLYTNTSATCTFDGYNEWYYDITFYRNETEVTSIYEEDIALWTDYYDTANNSIVFKDYSNTNTVTLSTLSDVLRDTYIELEDFDNQRVYYINTTNFNYDTDSEFTIDSWASLIDYSKGEGYSWIFNKYDEITPEGGYTFFGQMNVDETEYDLLCFNMTDATVGRGLQRCANVTIANGFHHFAVTYDGTIDITGIKLFINGTEQSYDSTYDEDTLLFDDDIITTVTPFTQEGNFSSVRVWSTNLSEDRLTAIYNEGREFNAYKNTNATLNYSEFLLTDNITCEVYLVNSSDEEIKNSSTIQVTSQSVINLLLNGRNTDTSFEHGSKVNIYANLSNGGSLIDEEFCLSIDIKGLGTNITCGNEELTYNWTSETIIEKLNGGDDTSINLTYDVTSGRYNLTFNITDLQDYYEIDSLLFNITGYNDLGEYPSNVKIYVNDVLEKNYIGTLASGNIEITDFNTSLNYSVVEFTDGSSIKYSNRNVYVNLPKNANVTGTTINMTGILGVGLTDDYTMVGSNIHSGAYTGSYSSGITNLNYAYDEDWGTRMTYSLAGQAWEAYAIRQNYTLPLYNYNDSFYVRTRNLILRAEDNDTFTVEVWNWTSSDWDLIYSNNYTDFSSNPVLEDRVPITNVTEISANYVNDFNRIQTRHILNLTGEGGLAISQNSYDYEELIKYYSYPNNVSFKVGGDNTVFSITNELNSSVNISGFESYINSYLDVCTADEFGNCLVPFTISSDTATVNLSNMVINYTINVNPVNISITNAQNSLSSNDDRIVIKIESNNESIIEISDLNLTYNGFQNISIDAIYYGNSIYSYSNATSIASIYYSKWNYTLPDGIIDLWFFLFSSEQEDVTPFGQTDDYPIFNISYYSTENNASLSAYIDKDDDCYNISSSLINTKNGYCSHYNITKSNECGGLSNGSYVIFPSYDGSTELTCYEYNTSEVINYTIHQTNSYSYFMRDNNIETFCNPVGFSNLDSSIEYYNFTLPINNNLDNNKFQIDYIDNVLGYVRDSTVQTTNIEIPNSCFDSLNKASIKNVLGRDSSFNTYYNIYCYNYTLFDWYEMYSYYDIGNYFNVIDTRLLYNTSSISLLNNTWGDITTLVTANDYTNQWLWLDLSCTNVYTLFTPDIYYRACCDNCICDEDVTNSNIVI